MKIKFYISIIITFLTFSVFAQDAELTVSVSKNKLGLNQRVRVIFTFNKQGGDNFKAPKFQNFEIVGGPSQSISQSWINGKTSFKQSYTYIIEPKRKGEFNLSSASIQYKGKTFTSKPIKIIVTDAVKTPDNPNDPNYIAKQNIHLVAEVSKANPYFGEGVYVEYRLYFSENIGIYDYRITESPQYNGFWTQQIDIKNQTVKTAMYNGESYRYAVMNKALLIPTKSGKLTINPMKMDIVVAIPTGKGDFFGNPITRQVKKSFQSSVKTIYAKELPLQGKPESFNGAVGDFTYEVNLNKGELKANESSEIKVVVKGKGNLKLFELPKIKTTNELEIYEPERKEKVSVTSGGLQGSVSETYTIVPQYKGKHKILGNDFSYFNPNDEKYHTIKIDDLYIDVLEGKELPKENVVVSSSKSSEISNNALRYIKTSTSFKSSKTTDFFNSILYYILLLLPLISIPLIIFMNKKFKGNKLVDSSIISDRLAKKYLHEAKNNLGNKEPFYESLERALYNYLKARLSIDTADINPEKISTLLSEKNVNEETIKEFLSVFEDCNFARYTPITDLQMQEEYEKVKQIITDLDKQL